MQQKTWQKRGLAAFLAIVLLVSAGAPVSAQAAGNDTPTEVGTWEELLEAANSGGSIQLTKSFSLEGGKDAKLTKIPYENMYTGLYVVQDLTIDLCGKTLTIEIDSQHSEVFESSGIMLASGATLTIMDSNSKEDWGELNVTNFFSTSRGKNGLGTAIHTTLGSLVIESGNVNATGGWDGAGIGGSGQGSQRSGGNIDIRGGNVNAKGGDYAAGIGGGYLGDGGNITISGDATIVRAQGDKASGVGTELMPVQIGTHPQSPEDTILAGSSSLILAVGSDDASTYQWYVSEFANGTNATKIEVDGTSESYTVPTNTIGTRYYFCMAIAPDYFGDISDIAQVTVVPNAPTDLEATHGNKSVTLTWSAPSNKTGIDGYKVSYKAENYDNWQTAEADTQPKTITGLTNGATYIFKVCAVGVSGTVESAFTDIVAATPYSVPDAPTALEAKRGNKQVTLSWTAPANLDFSDAYRIYYQASGDTTWKSVETPISTTTATIDGLINGTEYTFKVCAMNTAAALESAEATATATPYPVPDAPTALEAKRGNKQVTLSWTAPAHLDFSDAYRIYYQASGDTTWKSVETPVSTTTATIDGLTNGTEYTFKVCAVNTAAALESAEATATATPAANTLPPNNNNNNKNNNNNSSNVSDPNKDKDADKPSDDTILPDTLPFTDVVPTDWFYGDVKYVWEHKTMVGVTDTLFAPNSEVTRGMVATVLWRMQGAPAANGSAPFTDLSQDWYKPAVAWCYENGVVLGYGNGVFGPEDNVTREQLMTMMHRYMTYAKTEYTVTEEYVMFPDEASISSYAKEAVQVLNKLGVVTGMPDGSIDPQGTATRAQLAAILHRFMALATK